MRIVERVEGNGGRLLAYSYSIVAIVKMKRCVSVCVREGVGG